MAYRMVGDQPEPVDSGEGKPRFERVVVKLSGEAFADSSVGFGLDYEKIALHIAVADPSYIRREEVPEDVLAEEREIYAKQAEGKPEHIVERIVEGKLKDYYKQVVLLDQPYIRDDKQTIQDLLDSYSAKVREKLVLRRFARFKVGEGA
jgi:elongation factor Ts